MSVQTIKSLIIDDDPFIRDLLQDKLRQYLPEVEIVATASSGSDGIERIQQYNPELVFLDVEMVDMTGFEMLSKLDKVTFKTIFITSYRHYAIKAIRFNALDYLVKPIDLGELKAAIKRFKDQRQHRPAGQDVQYALMNMNAQGPGDEKLYLQTQEGEMRLELSSIIRIEGERNYSSIHLLGRKKKLASKTLSDLEELLEGKGFFRCHKSHLVNGSHIVKQLNSFSVLLSDDTVLPISRRRKEAFEHWLDNQ